ncbi:synaptotagmin-1-like [Rhopilema esculentum]|uniref:synaptotagmin-1-like n=1 Tax=Rhopilema esculentum TaxID=499914 RepID=UPI0031D8FCBB
MTFSQNVKLGLLIGISIFIAAFVVIIGYLVIKCCYQRKTQLERDKKGSFKKLDEKRSFFKDEALKPQFGEQKEFIFQEGSFKSIESESPSATPPPYNEDLRKLRIGKFEFTPTYYHNRKRLQVVIRRVTCYPVCQSLLNVAYLYIVACLLPDKKDFFESELQQINEDNLVDELCEFEVSYSDLDKRVLLFEIHVCDRFSRHLMISDLKYDLLKRPRTEHEESSLEKLDFKEHTGNGDDLLAGRSQSSPEILISLCYMPTSGRLTFVALKGKNLKIEEMETGDIFLRISLIQGNRTMKTVTTNAVRRSTSPVYNEAFVFHVPIERVKEAQILIRIILRSENKKEKVLSQVTIGTNSDSNLGRKHWEAMLLSARRPIAHWHTVTDLE